MYTNDETINELEVSIEDLKISLQKNENEIIDILKTVARKLGDSALFYELNEIEDMINNV